jgi:hypothetical protein
MVKVAPRNKSIVASCKYPGLYSYYNTSFSGANLLVVSLSEKKLDLGREDSSVAATNNIV